MIPRGLQLACEILTLLFEVGGTLVQGLPLDLEFGDVPSELVEVGGPLVKGLPFGLECGGVPSEFLIRGFDAVDFLRAAPSSVLEKRPKQRRRAVERLSNLIERRQCVATAVSAFLEQKVHCLTRLSDPIGQRRRYVQSLDSYFVVAKILIDELFNLQLDRT